MVIEVVGWSLKFRITNLCALAYGLQGHTGGVYTRSVMGGSSFLALVTPHKLRGGGNGVVSRDCPSHSTRHQTNEPTAVQYVRMYLLSCTWCLETGNKPEMTREGEGAHSAKSTALTPCTCWDSCRSSQRSARVKVP